MKCDPIKFLLLRPLMLHVNSDALILQMHLYISIHIHIHIHIQRIRIRNILKLYKHVGI